MAFGLKCVVRMANYIAILTKLSCICTNVSCNVNDVFSNIDYCAIFDLTCFPAIVGASGAISRILWIR